MPVAGAVVEGGAVLKRLLDPLDSHAPNAIAVGRRRLRGKLECIQRDPRVSADDLGKRRKCFVLNLDPHRGEPAFLVRERGFQDALDLLRRKWLELEDA